MADVPADWLAAAVLITPGFEAAGDPYIAVSGDFDGMGISCGALQWNIGQRSLQPMVKGAGRPVVRAAMPEHGEELWEACSSPVATGLKIVRGWQTGRKLKAQPRKELIALLGTNEMRAQQDDRIKVVGASALEKAEDWATSSGNAKPTKRLFCWFFDLVTQNGGLEGLTAKEVADFIKFNRPERADDVICDFLESREGTGHAADARKNAALWRNKATGHKLELLCMSYLRANTALPKWRHVVLNRKGCIALGSGWVNSSKVDLSKHGL